jgi:hypothetical protein
VVIKLKRIKIAIGILAIALLLIPAVGAGNITAKVGETWIKWSWSATETPANVYVDGSLKVWNSSFNYYYLDNAEPLEKHTIQIYNSSNTSQKWEDSTISTLFPKGTIFFLVGIEIVLTLILLMAKDNIKIILIGAVTIALALFTSRIALGYEGIYLLPVLIAICAGAYTAWSIWKGAQGSVAWY